MIARLLYMACGNVKQACHATMHAVLYSSTLKGACDRGCNLQMCLEIRPETESSEIVCALAGPCTGVA